MANEFEKSSTEITTQTGEVIVFDDPSDSAQYSRTADIVRTISATRSKMEEAKYVDDDAEITGGHELLTPPPQVNNISNMGMLPLPEYIRRVHAIRASKLNSKPAKAAR